MRFKQLKGIKVEDYSNEKKQFEDLTNRKKKDLKEINQDIETLSARIATDEEKKQQLLVEGTREDFLQISDDLRKEKDSLEYYQKKKERLEEISRIKPDELKAFCQEVLDKQSRLNRECLTAFREHLKGLVSVLEEVNRELLEGDKLMHKLQSQYSETASKEEAAKTIPALPGYDILQKRAGFNERSVALLYGKIKSLLDYLEQPALKEWFND